MPLDDEQLLKLAEQEILAENQRAAARYELQGPSGWNPCPLQKTNKIFLANTIRQVVSSNRIRDRPKNKPVKKRERKFFQSREGNRSNNIIFSPPKTKTPTNSASTSKDKTVIKSSEKKIETITKKSSK